MHIEKSFLSKVIATGNLKEVYSKGIHADHFVDEECRDMFEFLGDYNRRYGKVPTLEAVKVERPKWEQLHGGDPIPYLLDKLVVLVKRRYAQEAVVELAEAVDDPERAKEIDLEFLEASRKLATLVPSVEVSKFKEGMEARIAEYEQSVGEGTKPGVSFGFPSLDRWTGGIQPHEFVTVSGFSGIGKSTLLKVIAFNAWVQGKTPLYVTLEEESRAVHRKFDAMAAGLDYNAMKHLELPDDQLKRWRDKASEVKGSVSEIPVIDRIRHCTPDQVFAETVRHKPDLVVIDYLSLMRTGRAGRGTTMWQSITEITQDLKQNARTLLTPILAAAQTNRSGARDGAELENLGGSISIAQDSDIVLGLFADDLMKAESRMQLRVNKNRDGKVGNIDLTWDHKSLTYQEHIEKFNAPGPPKTNGKRQRPARK